MNADDIIDIILKKGKMVQELFFIIYYCSINDILDSFDGIDKDMIAILSYNITRGVVQTILDNQSYYAEFIYSINRYSKRAIKDLENMPRIEYPDKVHGILYSIELNKIDNF